MNLPGDPRNFPGFPFISALKFPREDARLGRRGALLNPAARMEEGKFLQASQPPTAQPILPPRNASPQAIIRQSTVPSTKSKIAWPTAGWTELGLGGEGRRGWGSSV